jgi:ERCC4-type nuclease
VLFVDPTETRSTSRLPQSVIDRAAVLPGLEDKTGADILVSPLSIPAASDTLLRRHTEAGLLVQRKSGGDLASSITDGRLARSLMKMLEWSPRAWLVVCARLDRIGERATLDGRETLGYSAIIGSLDWWQLRGGYYTTLTDDSALLAWLGGWMDRLRTLGENPIKVLVRNPQQSLAEDRQRSFLMALPGIGEERAGALLGAAGSPLSALQRLVNGTSHVPGIGKETREGCREWLSMDDGETLLRVPEGWVDLVSCALLSVIEKGGPDRETAVKSYAALQESMGIECESEKGWTEWVNQTNLPPM